MRFIKTFWIGYLLGAALGPASASDADSPKARIAVVSSYHSGYLWSQDTNRGVVKALLDFGYLDSQAQADAFTRDHHVESSTAVVQKLWMDTKRKNSPAEMSAAVDRTVAAVDAFIPDILLLGDDNATNLIGNHYVDTELPVVFWGVNGHPLKYDLVDSIERPGHNVTGIYQAGYLRECVLFTQKLIPGIQKIAVLSDASPTGRSKAKELMRLVREEQLPVELVATVVTNSEEQWKASALELSPQVDAFFVLNHNTLRTADGAPVDQLAIGAWYLKNIRKPEISHERQFVEEGMLAAVDDSGFRQGYEAVKICHRILHDGESPSTIPVYAPARGPFVVNLERAAMLGLTDVVNASPAVEERIETALALTQHP